MYYIAAEMSFSDSFKCELVILCWWTVKIQLLSKCSVFSS